MLKNDLTGQRFGRLIVLNQAGKTKDRHTLWKCLCSCGNEKIIGGKELKSGHTQSCGCYGSERRKEFDDLSGKRFGRLLVIKPIPDRKCSQMLYECKCDCGNISFVRRSNILSGGTMSCGCLAKELLINRSTKHQGTGSRLHRIWKSMKTRCLNSNSDSYLYYGRKGISICEEWKSDFSVFREWALANGYSDILTLDRINGDEGYCPQNCRWATWHEQRINQKRCAI